MSEATANLKAMDLDQVCRLVETLADSISNTEMSHLILELARRARVMDQHLSPKQEPEDESMPEPVEVWLQEAGDSGWHAYATALGPGMGRWGPFMIVPGMMSLDELAAKDYYIGNDYSSRIWYPYQVPCHIAHTTFPTALEAQWAATQLTKKVGG